MSEEEIKGLKRKRGNLKRQLTNLETVLDEIRIETDISCLDLETRLTDKHLPLLDEFEPIQDRLEQLTDNTPDDIKKNEDERSHFENRYYSICGRIKTLLKRGGHIPFVPLTSSFTSPLSRGNPSSIETEPIINLDEHSVETRDSQLNDGTNVTGNSSSIRVVNQGSNENNERNRNYVSNSNRHFARVKYPDLKIPTFSGSLDTWLSFFDSFSSMIHNDRELPTIQKFHYLKGSLEGDAANIIASLETTTENYQVAWDLLKNWYHNKKFIIDNHIQALLKMPYMSKEFTIRTLYDYTQKHIRALHALGVQVNSWDAILIRVIKNKLNNYTIEKWEESTCNDQNPTLQNILDFLERRSQVEETRAAINDLNIQKPQIAKTNSHGRQNSRQNASFSGATTTSAPSVNNSQKKVNNSKTVCFICKGDHGVFACSQFLNLSPKERYETVRKLTLCPNCLRGNHSSKNCFFGGCRKCGKRHNSLLHIENFNQESNQSQPNTNISKPQSDQSNNLNENNSPVSNYQLLIPSEVVLATAIVDAVDSKGTAHACRIMLDGGSQPHVITERFANKLGLKKTPVNVPLGAIDNLSTTVKYVANATIKSRFNNLKCNLSLFVVQTIGNMMPSAPIDRKSFSVPSEIFLADNNFQTPSEVDIILGAQYFYHFLKSGKILIEGHSAVIQETEFGLVVAGTFNHKQNKQSKSYCNFNEFSNLSLLWELKSPTINSLLSEEEEACEINYKKTTLRDKFGCYIVQLPFNEKISKLGDSRNAALSRFRSLENKFRNDPILKNKYTECINSYLKEGHMTSLENETQSNHGFFLPHHTVVKSSSLTTKTRVVFDGSCKSSSGISLNDTLMVGPTIQSDLVSTFTRFRKHAFALTADIEQMYRQVKLCKEHIFYHKLFWRENPNFPIKEYTLNTVTFGTACAPFLAIRTLHQLADDECKTHPLAATVLKRDFYVDDLTTGANTFEEALELRNDLIALLKKGGFNLRKWGSNDPRLINDLQNVDANSHMSLDFTETIKTLGLCWNPNSDTIFYTINVADNTEEITKRSIFSKAAKIYDPLGLLGPVLVVAKLLIQVLWKESLNWDEIIPPSLRETWTKYKNQLPLLNHVQFNRFITITNAVEIQLHGFCDASEKAYGACVYLRSTDSNGTFHVSLICSKSRVAPLKQVTLPRLELCAAVLLSNLHQNVFESLNMKINKSYFWSDSMITLHWINTPSNTLQTFVANRVADIQNNTNPSDWKHVPSEENPADYVSRGQMPHDFLKNEIWQKGPIWLSQSEDKWPQMKPFTNEILELKKIKSMSFKVNLLNANFLLERFSSFRTLKNVFSFCMRFIHNTKGKNQISGPLTVNELEDSELKIIKLVQLSKFAEEINALSQNKIISSKSNLISLNPFLENGILKVGGRLQNALIPKDQKHPIVLPKEHHVTKLIIREEHVSKLHAGTQATLYGVREKYWSIDGRNLTRHIVRQCVKCFRAKPRGADYLMGNLPEHRLSCSRPFSHVGIDYCGPFFIKEKRHRNRNKIKTYVCIFVCFSTKAVHLELVGDLTTESFLSCLKRFFARRGKANTIYSDNATNFIGANNELKELGKVINSTQNDQKIQTFLSKERVNWRFIPPRSPHMGGLWEASVKSFKHHLIRTVGNTLLTHEQLETYVIEIKAILNSRPLSPLSSDPNDLLPLAPGHFLIGSPLTTLPEADLRDVPVGRLSSWQHAQQMRQHFWTRWQKEYLNHMISRSKWKTTTNQDNIQVGTLVVLKEDNLPPLSWKLGRIIEVHPGIDNIIRVVTVRTNNGQYKRSVKRLYPLPIFDFH